MQKKDFIVVFVIGLLIGGFGLFPLRIILEPLAISFPPLYQAVFPLACALFALLALFVLKLLSRKFAIFEKFGKFAAVGTLNTVIDFGIVNAFIAATGIPHGWPFVGFKAVSFLVATTNSYFWNKFWTFQSAAPVSAQEYARFAAFTLFGVGVNVAVASLVVNILPRPHGMIPEMWANVGVLAAVLVSFMVNFLNYNKFVFKKKNPEPSV